MACCTRRRQSSIASPARRTAWNGSITATASGSSSVVAVLKPVKPSIATTSTLSRKDWSRSASQFLKACLERPGTMSSNRAGPVPSRIGVRSLITVTNLSPRPVCRQQCSSTPMTFTPSNRVGSLISTRRPSARTASLAVSHDTARASAMRATVKCWHNQGFQRPPQRAARQPGSRLGSLRRVLPPYVTAAGAPVAAHRHQQRRGSPPERLVRQLAGHAVPRRSFITAPATPPVVLGDAAGQHRSFRLQSLPDHDEAELVEAAERVQAGSREGSSVKHVEVFRVAGVGTSILGRPRPLHRHRRAGCYTLKSEEPSKGTEEGLHYPHRPSRKVGLAAAVRFAPELSTR